MPKSITLTVGVDSTSGPFPPTYPAGASGFTAAGSNPSGSSAGALSSNLYFGATILAIANEKAVSPTEFTFALAGTFDQSFIGAVTTPDGKVYSPSNAVYVITQIGVNTVTVWTWPLAAGGVALVTGTVGIADTGDVLINLTGNSESSTQINLAWTNTGPTPPTNYQLFRGVGTATPTLYQTLANNVLSFSDTGLTASSQYNYAVIANYADGTVSSSVQLNLFTPASGISDTFNCNCEVMVPDGWTTDTLAALRLRVLIRCGYASQAANPPPGMILFVNEMLQDAQKQLYRQHSEFRQKRMYAWQMEPNVRYYSLTQDESGCRKVDPLSVDWVGFEDLNQAWYYLTAGINPVMYTRAQISTGWPTHYEIRSCIEIFPAPKAPYTLWIKGRFGLDRFTLDADTTTVDAEAIYLLACGMVKAHYQQADASNMLSEALAYTKYLVAGQHLTRRYVPDTKVNPGLTPPRFLPLGNGPA